MSHYNSIDFTVHFMKNFLIALSADRFISKRFIAMLPLMLKYLNSDKSICYQILKIYLKNLFIRDCIPFFITIILSIAYSLDSFYISCLS